MATTSNPTEDGFLRTIQSVSRTNSEHNKKIMQNTKSFENFSYFLGGIDVTHQNLDQFTPYIRGVSRLFLHKPPLFMEKLDAAMTRRFKTYIETGFKSVNGISDIEMDFTSFDGGFAGQQYQTPQLARDNTDTVTVSVYELSGSPIREYLDTWITGVRDPRSGIAHYHGLIENNYNNKDTGMYYSEINHTCEFVYNTYDPTGLFMEYACMFAHCFPKRVPKEHLNYDSGNRDNAQIDIDFSTTKYESPAINDIGIWYTMNSKVNFNYLDFNPEFAISNLYSDGRRETRGTIGQLGTYTYDYGAGGQVNTRTVATPSLGTPNPNNRITNARHVVRTSWFNTNSPLLRGQNIGTSTAVSEDET